ncbi:MAG: hypothetical protein JRG90_21730 [Deltaproteobacteria bacterium]|nr:hypothetical protein [Deltaproteobacteria bacterium]
MQSGTAWCRLMSLLLLLLLLVCGSAVASPGRTAAVPLLQISLADPLLASPTALKKARVRAAAVLELGTVEAPGKVDLSNWTEAAGSDPSSRIAVELKKKSRLMGMRRFTLRKLEAVGFQDAPLVFAHLRREGLLAPRIRFVRVRLGSAELGLMALEESYSKELLESQQRREGLLLRFRSEGLPVVRVDAFQSKRVRESEQLSTELGTASGLLQAFLRGEVPTSAVFASELMARFIGVAMFWDAEALLRAENLRFYFNPVTQRLEPVGFSGGLRISGGPSRGEVVVASWAARLFEDAELRQATVRESQRIAREMALASPPAWFEEEERRLLGILDAAEGTPDKPSYEPWLTRAAKLAIFVPPAPLSRDDALRLSSDPKAASLRANPIPTATLDEALKQHSFLRWDDDERTLRANSGDWRVVGSLVLPEGIGLAIGPGTTLRFSSDSMLVASGPLRFQGRAEAPVVLRGRAVLGGGRSWQGVVVLRSGAPHDWRHVVVADTTGIDYRGWRLTGGCTLRASEVRFVDSRFEGVRAEDAINLIRSRFEFRGVSILDTSSDAFDCDFCEGSVTGGRIERVGGDGIDISGSVVGVDGTVLEDIRDKAISVGEGSRLEARNLLIRKVGTAVVGKDGSSVVFVDSAVSDVQHVAIMAYTKKREYGAGSVIARNIEMIRVGRAASAQHGSQVLIDGVATATGEMDIDGLYKRGYMKK